jgi:hypothetical protein
MKNINHNGKSTKIAYYPCSTSNSPLKPYFPKTNNSTAAHKINANISIDHKDKSTKKEKQTLLSIRTSENYIFIPGFQNLF